MRVFKIYLKKKIQKVIHFVFFVIYLNYQKQLHKNIKY